MARQVSSRLSSWLWIRSVLLLRRGAAFYLAQHMKYVALCDSDQAGSYTQLLYEILEQFWAAVYRMCLLNAGLDPRWGGRKEILWRYTHRKG